MKPRISSLLSATVIIFALFFSFNSCRKTGIQSPGFLQDEQIRNKFLSYSSGTDNQVMQIIHDLDEKDKQHPFIVALAKADGYPDWKNAVKPSSLQTKSTRANTDAASYVLVPLLADSSKKTTSLLGCRFQDSLDYRLFRANDYHNMPVETAGDYISVFLSINSTVFGYKDYKVNDGRLFKSSYSPADSLKSQYVYIRQDSANRTNNNQQANRVHSANSLIEVLHCTTFTAPCGPDALSAGTGAHGYCEYERCYEMASGWFYTGAAPPTLPSSLLPPVTNPPSNGGNGGVGGGSGGGSIGDVYEPVEEAEQYRIIAGKKYTPEYYPGKNRNLPWLWWESTYNYQKWLNHDITIIDDLVVSLDLSNIGIYWLLQNPVEGEEIQQFLNEYNHSTEAIIASKITAELMVNGLEAKSNNAAIENTFNIYAPPALKPSTTSDPFFWYFIGLETAFNKIDHPEWSRWKCFLEAMDLYLHGGLDMAGLIPGVGEVADLTNGGIYLLQGNGTDASFSFASAIPIVGWGSTVAKYARKTIIAIDGTKRTLKWIKNANNIISFGDRSLLRKVLGLAAGDLRQAHHIIPWEFADNPLIQKAAQKDFHMNEILNGIPLDKTVHVEGMVHSVYNTNFSTELQNIIDKAGGINNITPDVAKSQLQDLISKIKSAINANPGVNLNDLVF